MDSISYQLRCAAPFLVCIAVSRPVERTAGNGCRGGLGVRYRCRHRITRPRARRHPERIVRLQRLQAVTFSSLLGASMDAQRWGPWPADNIFFAWPLGSLITVLIQESVRRFLGRYFMVR